MADPIAVQVDNRLVLDALQRLVDGTENPSPALKAIGEDLAESTRRRFASSTAPDGTPWAPNAEVTLQHYLDALSGSRKKDGSLSKKGAARLGTKKPLIGETQALSRQIYWQLVPGGVEVGSSMVYAAMQQFGGTKAQFPHLWGDIPARPFLGLSDDDVSDIEQTIEDYLASLIG